MSVFSWRRTLNVNLIILLLSYDLINKKIPKPTFKFYI